MNNGLDIIVKVLLPFVLLGIGAIFVLDRMKADKKIEAKIKWKEEFRIKLINFINKSIEIEDKSRFLSLNDKQLGKEFITEKFVLASKELDSAFYAIDIMLKEIDNRVELLNEHYRTIKEGAFDVFENKKEEVFSDSIDMFYKIAKEIYNDNKCLNKII